MSVYIDELRTGARDSNRPTIENTAPSSSDATNLEIAPREQEMVMPPPAESNTAAAIEMKR